VALALIVPDWPAPAGVCAFSTTRAGGVSQGAFARLNLGLHVSDDPAAVAVNRQRLLMALPAGCEPVWLQQVHGSAVANADTVHELPVADACLARSPLRACIIMTADCLPVLLCDNAGSVVAAAHAGWRGLVDGVLEATVAAMAAPPGELLAWLGPAIGPASFEVGAEVRTRALDAVAPEQRGRVAACFNPAGRPGKYLANLYALARQRLTAAGVTRVYGEVRDTFGETELFFSYRRDGMTGRMATGILLKPE